MIFSECLSDHEGIFVLVPLKKLTFSAIHCSFWVLSGFPICSLEIRGLS